MLINQKLDENSTFLQDETLDILDNGASGSKVVEVFSGNFASDKFGNVKGVIIMKSG